MTKSRMAVLGAVAALALLLVGGAGPAAAQSTTKLAKTVKMTGKAKNGKKFTGTYTIDRFTRKGGRQFAVGTVKGRLKGRRVTRKNVRVPVTIQGQQTAGASQTPTPTPELPVATPGACPVLNLVLGPIDLNLLGLRVATNEIRALIEAIPGGGNLLGNLVCAVAHLLDPQPPAPATPATPSQLTQFLNALLALVPRTA
jgi:hypothetical protein